MNRIRRAWTRFMERQRGNAARDFDTTWTIHCARLAAERIAASGQPPATWREQAEHEAVDHAQRFGLPDGWTTRRMANIIVRLAGSISTPRNRS